MDFLSWLIFLGTSLFIALTPGPGVLLAVSNSAKFGIRIALISSLGNAIGLFLIAAATVIGLGAILKSSIIIFTLLKFFGAIYLIYLGIRQWRSKINVFNDSSIEINNKLPTTKKLLLQGLFLAITNPKMIIFFAAIFPQFIKTNQPIMSQFIILTLTSVISTNISHVIYAYLSHSAKIWFSLNYRAKIFNRFSGGIFMLFGISMLRLKNSQS